MLNHCQNHFAFCRNWAVCSDHYKLNFYLCGFLEDTQSDMELMEIFYLRLCYKMQFIQCLIPLLTKFSFCSLNVTRTTAKAPYPHSKSSPPSRSRRYCFHSGWSPQQSSVSICTRDLGELVKVGTIVDECYPFSPCKCNSET